MINVPALKSLQPGADGLDRHPALKTVGGIGRKQETAVSGYGAPQETPQGRATLQSRLFAGEISKALLQRRIASCVQR
jgi:hypothetical protein